MEAKETEMWLEILLCTKCGFRWCFGGLSTLPYTLGAVVLTGIVALPWVLWRLLHPVPSKVS